MWVLTFMIFRLKVSSSFPLKAKQREAGFHLTCVWVNIFMSSQPPINTSSPSAPFLGEKPLQYFWAHESPKELDWSPDPDLVDVQWSLRFWVSNQLLVLWVCGGPVGKTPPLPMWSGSGLPTREGGTLRSLHPALEWSWGPGVAK